MLAKLLEQHHRQQAGPGPALAITWKSPGAWLVFSQSRQVNVCPDVPDHFPRFRDHLQRLGDVLAELDSRN